ncbi:hypothetical protein H4687_005869 [Streptomyces stelliscabiei]|uniref:Uncharacterized protein n=1 Tax=Streptomyces stelliscabiei TaxID=146820 RepID=A0A8I0P7I5_9ACTN|nr:hypothetical protein [Streptomyces stelliscabiei]MBE1599740.1 hypothetical protein [Streptomyces stelliscabiei]
MSRPRRRAYRALLLLGAALTTAELVLTACTGRA